ncbi:MAG: N-6 DNA methylase [Bacteroidetes bacterium]|nr:N-6 DNA methylase [Bacteroidota bacterium]
MEGETKETIEAQTKLFHDRILPTLDNNIKSGNSLIDLDYYDNELDFGEERKIKPFSWQKAFPEVFQQGGFDCVIGNPPWGAELGKEQTKYLVNRYSLLPTKTKDSYFAFVFRSLNLLKTKGKLGFIIPNTWLLINYAQSFRKFILGFKIDELIDFGDGVFSDAIVESSTIVLENLQDEKGNCKVKRIRKGETVINQTVKKSIWNDDELQRIIIEKDEKGEAIRKKIKNDNTEIFGTNCEMIWGIKPYQVGHGTPAQTKEMLEKRIYHSDKKISNEWKPLLVGSHINRYSIYYKKYQFIKYGKNLMYPSNEEKMLAPKILMRQTSDILRASYDDQKFYCQNSVFIITSNKFNLKYLLGLINSTLFNFLYKLENPQKGKVFAEVKPSAVKSLPIKLIETKAEKTKHDEIVKNVDLLLQLNQEKQEAKLESKIEQLQNRIDFCEEKINQIVYQLYELSEDETKIVENA